MHLRSILLHSVIVNAVFRTTGCLAVLCSILLAGCGGASSITYDVTITQEDPTRASLLKVALMRVVEERLRAIGDETDDLELSGDTDNLTLTVGVGDPVVKDILTEVLMRPFTFSIMEETREGEDPDIEVEGHGGFSHTGVTKDHLEWLEAKEDTTPGKGRVQLFFTDEGMTIMERVFEENSERFIGVFVREKLVAKLYVDTDSLKDNIMITDIPSLELARIFANDVNVGVHVAFSPRS